MGRADHDGQQLEHLPETRLGRGARPSDRGAQTRGCPIWVRKRKYSPRVPQREFLSLPPLSFSSLYLLGLHPTAVDTRRSPATTKDAFQCLVVRATLDDLLCPFPSCTCWPPRPLAGVFFPTSRRRRNELRVAVLSIESALARRLTTDAK